MDFTTNSAQWLYERKKKTMLSKRNKVIGTSPSQHILSFFTNINSALNPNDKLDLLDVSVFTVISFFFCSERV